MQYSNNAVTTFAAGIGTTDTTFVCVSGGGAKFPLFTAAAPGYLTFYDAATGAQIEIVKCTGRTSDTFTIQRAQDGTSAKSYLAGDRIGQELVAAQLRDFATLSGGGTFASPIYAPTPTAGDSSTAVATTAFVASSTVASGVTSFNGRVGVVVPTTADITGALGFSPASLAGATFTGPVIATNASIVASSGGAQISTKDSSAGTDAKIYDLVNATGTLSLRAVNDANTAANSVVTINRTGYAPTALGINTKTTVTYNGSYGVSLVGSATNQISYEVNNTDASGGHWCFGVYGSTGTVPGAFFLSDVANGLRLTVNASGLFSIPSGRMTITDASNTFPTSQVTNTGTTGATFKLTGNGASTPSKTIRALGGNFDVVNDANTVAIFSVSDAGNATCAAGITATGYNIPSSAALKKDFQPVDGALDRVLSWKPKTYRYKADPERVRTGLLVEESPANIVSGKTLDLVSMVADLASALQDLAKEVRGQRV